MITLDLATAVATYLIVTISIVFSAWIFYNYRSYKDFQSAGLLRQCPYCTHLFMDIMENAVLICPRCHSYIEQKETNNTD